LFAIEFRIGDIDDQSKAVSSSGDGKSKNLGFDYSRHPNDPTDDDIDIDGINRLLRVRHDARRKQEFDLADNIRAQLKTKHRVFVVDHDRTWSTIPANVGITRTLKSTSVDDSGPIAHRTRYVNCQNVSRHFYSIFFRMIVVCFCSLLCFTEYGRGRGTKHR
jgi:hypothetical protein